MSHQKKKRDLYLSFFIATLELLKNAVFLQRAGCGPACGHWAGTQRAKRPEKCLVMSLTWCTSWRAHLINLVNLLRSDI